MAEGAARIAAIDLGASSGRVIVGHGTEQRFTLREIHRFPNRPRLVDGALRWDARALFAGILDGLRSVPEEAGPLNGVSVDGWAVDYGLLDDDGDLIADPASYRDTRTGPPFAAVTNTPGGVAGVDAARLYEATGIAVHPINTVFQLMAERESAQIGTARHALLVPDLMTYWLSGQMGTELTNASTTGLLDTRTMNWATGVADALGVPAGLFPRLRAAGELAGPIIRTVAADLGLPRPPQVVVGPSHDTAAAVVGIPARDDAFAFVCTGTWALAGVELATPVITSAAREAGFSNEVGVDGTIRFLRNVTGFWLLQECVREWESEGRRVDLGELTDAASEIPGLHALIDVQDPRFVSPGGMTQRISRLPEHQRRPLVSGRGDPAMHLGQHGRRDPARGANAVRLTGRPVNTVHVNGGGVANSLFCQLVANACGLPTVAGPTEAASWGNVLVQARALGLVGGSLPELRSVVRRSVHLTGTSRMSRRRHGNAPTRLCWPSGPQRHAADRPQN